MCIYELIITANESHQHRTGHRFQHWDVYHCHQHEVELHRRANV